MVFVLLHINVPPQWQYRQTWALDFTHPHFNVISGGLWQLFVEPWRSVEAAASVGGPTASTIPQWVIGVEHSDTLLRKSERACQRSSLCPQSWEEVEQCCPYSDN